MTTNEATATQTRYFRTVKGNAWHTDFHCANYRRSIQLGAVIELTAAETEGYAPCEVCAPNDMIKAAAVKAAEKADAMCRNSGVTHPQRIQSVCQDCNKRGTVDRRTGALRAHKPQA